MIRRAELLLSAALICGCVWAASAAAQDKSKGKTADSAGTKRPQPPRAAPVKQKRKPKQAPQPTAVAHGAAPKAPPPVLADDEGAVRKEGATDIKAVEFTGLDIEGQLKTPQMLYFLNRLRAEFARPELPHRSFMPELSRSSKEKDL